MNPQPARALITQLAEQLAEAGIDNPRFEARLLLGLALGREDAPGSHEELALDQQQKDRLAELLQRRCAGEPPSRLRGWREFYGLRFRLNSAMLDPRPDSEILVEAALSFADQLGPDKALRVADFGTGSGCLLLSLLAHLPNASGAGLDISAKALEGAAENARTLGLAERVQFVAGEWQAQLPQDQFDIILANPPYIRLTDKPSLAREVVLHDPPLALFGGADGLEAWRVLLPVLARRLAARGRAFVEIGSDQAVLVTDLAQQSGLYLQAQLSDLSGQPRCLVFIQKGEK
jgi:release factor glutamine methyltransferase